MTKIETVRSLPGSEIPLSTIQAIQSLQKQLRVLRPQRQLQSALEQMQREFQTIQSQSIEHLAQQSEQLLEEMLGKSNENLVEHSQRIQREFEVHFHTLRNESNHHLVEQSQQTLNELQEHIETIQERSGKHLAEQLEPMAQKMADLSETMRTALIDLQVEAKNQGARLVEVEEQLSKRGERAAEAMEDAADRVGRFDRNFLKWMVISAGVGGLCSGFLMLGFLFWLHPEVVERHTPLTAEQQASIRFRDYLLNELRPKLKQGRQDEIQAMLDELSPPGSPETGKNEQKPTPKASSGG